jgi:1-acyl-sn-glycerol-3-phosphate acyltransferase
LGWAGGLEPGEPPHGAVHTVPAPSENGQAMQGQGTNGQGTSGHGKSRKSSNGTAPGLASAPRPEFPPGGPPADPGRDHGHGPGGGNGLGPVSSGSVPPDGDWRSRLAGVVDFARRQVTGDGEVDEFGFDPEFNSRLLIPAARLLYQQWFQVQMRGLEHVPGSGPAMLVANHSGVLPFDAIMLQTGLHDDHPGHRNLRLLGADLVYEVPGLSYLARRAGHIRACPANAHRLLTDGELVGVFPEGFKGIGKPFRDRYQLRRFGRGGFAVSAIRAGAPIVPCAIVGAEEIYPMVGNAKSLARLFRLPYFPVTPLFPWLGPVGAIPLPSKWIIEFCPAVPTDGYPAASWQDPDVIADLAAAVRRTVQRKLDELLAERGPAFG